MYFLSVLIFLRSPVPGSLRVWGILTWRLGGGGLPRGLSGELFRGSLELLTLFTWSVLAMARIQMTLMSDVEGTLDLWV